MVGLLLGKCLFVRREQASNRLTRVKSCRSALFRGDRETLLLVIVRVGDHRHAQVLEGDREETGVAAGTEILMSMYSCGNVPPLDSGVMAMAPSYNVWPGWS